MVEFCGILDVLAAAVIWGLSLSGLLLLMHGVVRVACRVAWGEPHPGEDGDGADATLT